MVDIQVVAVLAILCYCVCSTTYSYNDSRLTYYGRHYTDSQGLKYDWPCFTTQFCFRNTTKVYWLGIDSYSHYQIYLNNQPPMSFIPHRSQKSLIHSSSTATSGCLKIVRITESRFGPLGTRKDSIFHGVQIDGQIQKIDRKFQYKLEFVGDSLTVGYGDMSGTNIKCFFRMRHNQNCMESWASHLSGMLNAEYRIIATSGIGVVKNAPFIFGQVMPEMYPRTTTNSKPNSYHFQDLYTPDAILIFLGVNDYNSIIKPNPNNFIFQFQKFFTQIVQLQHSVTGKYPKIIAFCSLDFEQELCKNVEQAVKAFHYAYSKVYFVSVPKGIFDKKAGNMGCIQHPNGKGQRLIAESVKERVKQILDS